MALEELGHEQDIGPLQQIPAGEGRNFDVGGRTIAVFQAHGGRVFATQPECPHKRGPLANGLTG
ncbi:Rieske (2Fe-2S) domain-containing protein [Novosphingobium sp. Rr 2-17]|uniref:Rieske (2Fe-2S) protein n=1 Tax=Novosphingobium sp. Rr 2-17 TaxID=555793 RepID=UPI0002699C23|nr:Rieske 2Fe-2S domain-containing protein [Novosphingobium sp. Rr 2-17]EIZ77381.1 Rieske (2Fe-2S) domain-containing protein [Novosphingobium sp. Rr 2-17]